ncbi:unnamed protein product [Phytophthora lilii]|uniref:Unnamed protein product n=1 Tax=Phytophthora lilii TaxID=2077276 RepID=A0A9W6XBF4_9STRA|nr:unnamed protein product [Phytophthora lilii]
MVITALVCISWTVWLIIFDFSSKQDCQLPDGHRRLEDGQFWLIPEKLTTLQAFSVAGLLIVLILYVSVLLKMLIWRAHRHVEGTLLDRILQHCAPDQVGGSADLEFSHRVRKLVWELYMFLKDLTGFHGKHPKIWVRSFHCIFVVGLSYELTMYSAEFMPEDF